MIIVTLLLFLLAASLGITLLFYVLKNKNTPKGLAFLHGSTAATALVFLIALLFTPAKPYLSLTVFVFAALAGFIMMYRDLTGKSLPKWLALSHGTLALIGFVLLVIALFIRFK